MMGQDSGQPWFLYWILNSLEITNQNALKLTESHKAKCVSYLRQCWNPTEGGFAGAPGLQVHVASTYAAMLAIANIGTKEAFDIVDRELMRKYLIRIKNNLDLTHEQKEPHNTWKFYDRETGELYKHDGTHNVKGTLPGSLPIQDNGEMDMRGLYCALVTADLLDLIDDNEEFTRGMGDFIASCQTYEGGISYGPYGESHGGYTFCGLAAMLLLKEADKLDLDKCAEWLAFR